MSKKMARPQIVVQRIFDSKSNRTALEAFVALLLRELERKQQK